MPTDDQPQAAPDASPVQRLAAIRLLALDVDGVLTDGSIILAGDGEIKRFDASDGVGIRLLLCAGILVAWISGRESPSVEHRARELGVTRLYQGARNKSVVLADLMASYALSQSNIAYMGDDLNDLPAYSLAGVKFAPANAVMEVKALADFVTERAGGYGAVREVCDAILKAKNLWTDAVTTYLSDLMRMQS
ncbi:MAG: KdsC family phosphatase [Chthonomonadales bacterium]